MSSDDNSALPEDSPDPDNLGGIAEILARSILEIAQNGNSPLTERTEDDETTT